MSSSKQKQKIIRPAKSKTEQQQEKHTKQTKKIGRLKLHMKKKKTMTETVSEETQFWN